MGELIAVQSVMERNPGLQSRITNKQLDDIRSNLRYLRDILHDLEASGAVQPEALEAFTNPSTQTKPTSDKRATLKELQEFQIKVVVEINRLGASGTSDPVIQARLRTLQLIKTDVDDVIKKLQNGSIIPETVPIFKSDIDKALPVLGSPTSPLGTLLKKNDLPPAFASLFPGGLSPKDTEQANQINNVAKGYMDNLLAGASWGINVLFKYDNPEVLRLKAMAAMNPENPVQGIPGIDKKYIPIKPNDSYAPSTSTVNSMTLGTDVSYNPGLPGTSNPSSRIFPPHPTGSIDWKQRSQQITEQIRKRGLNPTDFGAMPENVQVSDSYSWRGYTQMLCNRLNTTPDPGLSVSVGCPPNNCPGWR